MGGEAAIEQLSSDLTTINQVSDKTSINWDSFGIQSNEVVNFIQPSANSIALNRVTGGDASVILGSLQANGCVFLVNSNGILFGEGAQVDVAGLLATTFNISDEDFMAGNYQFSNNSNGSVVNRGNIHVADNGFVILTASGVSNEGLIVARLGKVGLGAGEHLSMDFGGDGLVTYAIDGKVLNKVNAADGTPLSAAVNNSGKIQADGGQVLLKASASAELFSTVINQSGVIEAKSLESHDGVIRLEGSDPVKNEGLVGAENHSGEVVNAEGSVQQTGTLDVSAAETGAVAGEITLSGESVNVWNFECARRRKCSGHL
jgi:filamentous hemagglutinin family protein